MKNLSKRESKMIKVVNLVIKHRNVSYFHNGISWIPGNVADIY